MFCLSQFDSLAASVLSWPIVVRQSIYPRSDALAIPHPSRNPCRSATTLVPPVPGTNWLHAALHA